MRKLLTTKKKYKVNGQRLFIPVKNGQFITGQERSEKRPNGLTQQEIKNPDLIPAERRPALVITPDNAYSLKISNNMNLDEQTPYMEAIRGLIELQQNIAPSKEEYNPAVHDWFIFDKSKEAKSKQVKFKNTKRAWDLVEDSAIARQKTLLLYANTRVDGHALYPDTMSVDDIYNAAVSLAQKEPDLVVEFFSKDKKVQQEVAILELIHNNVISSRNGHYYDGQNYLGSNNKEVIDYFNNPQNASTRDRLFKKLSVKKSGSMENGQTQQDLDSIAAASMLEQAKVRFVDEEYQEALDIIKDAQSKMINQDMREQLDKWKQKILATISGEMTNPAAKNDSVDLQEMNEEGIRTFFRKTGVKGWNNKMTKKELIDYYKNQG